MDLKTRSAFRLVSHAAVAVATPFAKGLKVRNSQDLAHALKAYESADIAKLELDGSNFCDSDLQSLPPSLRELSIIGAHSITVAGLEHLNNLPRLESLKLQNCGIDDFGAEALAGNTSITTLCLRDNLIGAVGAHALAGNTSITTLDLSDNAIGDEDAQALAGNTSITTLDLSDNAIGDQGAMALAGNTSITSLNLSGNEIGAEGAQALAVNTSITTLDLRRQRHRG